MLVETQYLTNSKKLVVSYVDKTGDIKLKYCPTEHMLADIFTKPLQGKLFFRLRDIILGTPKL